MQHASESTLRELAPLLERLRSLDGLVEKRPGVFYRRSKAFLHFHEDPSGLFVDVRFRVDEPFTRLPVSTDAQRAALVKMINQALPPDGQSPTRSRTTQSKRST